MSTPNSVADLTELGRVRLSENFFMREMLYSEVANFHGMPNIPDDPALAVEAGEKLCQLILEPLHEAFGGIAVRSAYRSAKVNAFCNEKLKQGQPAYYCGDNEYSAARHIWDLRDADGHLGATASVVVPWYLDRYEQSGDYHALAWWIRDNIAAYAEVIFFPWQCSFNIRWYEGPSERAIYYDFPPEEGVLTKNGMDNFEGDHSDLYPGFPAPRSTEG
jgi:hypothetical protein